MKGESASEKDSERDREREQEQEQEQEQELKQTVTHGSTLRRRLRSASHPKKKVYFLKKDQHMHVPQTFVSACSTAGGTCTCIVYLLKVYGI